MILVKYIPLRRNNPSQFIPIRKTVPVYNFCFDDSTTFPFKLPIFLSFFLQYLAGIQTNQMTKVVVIDKSFISTPFRRGKSIPVPISWEKGWFLLWTRFFGENPYWGEVYATKPAKHCLTIRVDASTINLLSASMIKIRKLSIGIHFHLVLLQQGRIETIN